MSDLKKPKPVPKPRIPRRAILRAGTTISLIERLEARNKAAKKKKKKKK